MALAALALVVFGAYDSYPLYPVNSLPKSKFPLKNVAKLICLKV